MTLATRSGRRRSVAALAPVVLVVLSLGRSAPVAAEPQPDPDTPQAAAQGFTRGGQGYLMDEGRFRVIAVPSATGTLPYGINNRRQIVGVYDDARGRSHGFVWEQGRFRTIDHPRATGTIPGLISGGGAFGINNRGQIVGAYVSRDGHLRGYLWERGRFRTIADAPGATDTTPIDINDRGQITIQASADEPFLNFLLDDGEFTRIEFPGAVGTTVHKIDNRGQIVGVYDDGRIGQHGFTLNRGRYRTLDFPGTTFTGVNSSNTRGQIVGYILEGDLAQPRLRGAILSRGRLTTFDAPGPPRGPAGTTAVDINDRGQIVGFKTPLPETTAASSRQAADMAPLNVGTGPTMPTPSQASTDSR